MNFLSASLRLCGVIILTSISILAQIPAPKDTLGFTPGDDRKLASWASIVDYFRKLDAASDRVMFQEIGKTTLGAPFVYATISSPENLKNLEKYKRVNSGLADPRRFKSNDVEAKKLIAQGKTIVLITCGIHSDEVGGTLSSMLIAHRLASSNEPDVKKILDNTIILLVPSLNPDGVDIVKNWYDKTLGTPYEGTDPPELYHHYVGHDDNRDWYAFTQVETQLTVDKIHNVWHPQIVHDIHQQGENGSRLFLPPYMQPVEPNVPKQIVEGYTELGNYMAKTMRDAGFQGITTDSTYDAWTPSRAYSHYHGGVRILSETASAKLATPVTIKYDDLRPGLGYDPKKETANFGPIWKGGEWHLRDITNYMTTAAFALMNHAADNREKWLSRFYEIGKEAVSARKEGETFAYIIDIKKANYTPTLVSALMSAGVQVSHPRPFSIGGKTYRKVAVVRLDQPYGAFAKALIEPQQYPDLLDKEGHPIPPYDVTAHSFALLTNTRIEKVMRGFAIPRDSSEDSPIMPQFGNITTAPSTRAGIYKSYNPSMDEGWTRWIFDDRFIQQVFWSSQLGSVRPSQNPIRNSDIRSNELRDKASVIIFPDQLPNSILNGYAKGAMPDEYVGGIGKEGVENLKKFVENGGTLVFLNRSSDFAIEQFKLPVKDVTAGLARKDFYIPGSILRTEIDTTHPIAKGMPAQSIAWFESGPVFEMLPNSSWTNRSVPPALAGGTAPDAKSPSANLESRPPANAGGTDLSYRVVATYPSDPKQILLSGWALGAEKIAGKAALVEFTIGKGKIILFGFRPQYRGQSLATFPLFFNAILQ